MGCRHCGKQVFPCSEGTGCRVACLHSPLTVPPALRVPCTGWRHKGGWHMCDPAADHALLAQPPPAATRAPC
jgi:hypothetical protein